MPAEEQTAAAYEEATDGCRHSLLGTADSARQLERVKPDPETNPLADLDSEKVSTWDDPLITTPRRDLCSGRTDCVASEDQPPALSVLPT